MPSAARDHPPPGVWLETGWLDGAGSGDSLQNLQIMCGGRGSPMRTSETARNNRSRKNQSNQ